MNANIQKIMIVRRMLDASMKIICIDANAERHMSMQPMQHNWLAVFVDWTIAVMSTIVLQIRHASMRWNRLCVYARLDISTYEKVITDYYSVSIRKHTV
jgi:hypothetical protein